MDSKQCLRPQDFPSKNSNIYQKILSAKSPTLASWVWQIESWRNSSELRKSSVRDLIKAQNQREPFFLTCNLGDFLLPAVFSAHTQTSKRRRWCSYPPSAVKAFHFLTYAFPSKWIQSSGIKQSRHANKFLTSPFRVRTFCHYIHQLTRKFHLEVPQLLHSSI